MPDYHCNEELQTYLVAQGIGQLPGATPSTALPSIWLNPRDGAPLPRAGENATVTIRDTALAGPVDVGTEAYLEEAFIDVIVRSKTAAPGKMLHRTIRGLLQPIGAHKGRQLWTMGGLLVEYSVIWRPEQPLPQAGTSATLTGASGLSSPVTYDSVASYLFGCRRKALAGLPYVP